jgi:hypothetical protein
LETLGRTKRGVRQDKESLQDIGGDRKGGIRHDKEVIRITG